MFTVGVLVFADLYVIAITFVLTYLFGYVRRYGGRSEKRSEELVEAVTTGRSFADLEAS